MENNFNGEEFTSEQQWEVVNTYREIRSDTPEMLWDNAVSYFRWCRDNPIEVYKTVMMGRSTGTKVKVELPIMYTIKGLCLHCNILEEFLRDCRTMKDTAPEWYIVASKIIYLIHDQNLTYAANDLFNSSIVAKVLTLDKDDVPPGKITIEHIQGLPELSNSENELLEKLESENAMFPKQE